jgi:GntR family transcriptional regulator, arabinose operon transcriptional repressor
MAMSVRDDRLPSRDGIPKHAQISSRVRQLVGRRVFPVGEAIPGEQELAGRFGCSRGTVRRALDTLVKEGLLRPKRGSGYLVLGRVASGREPLLGLIQPNILNAEMLRLSQRITLEAGRLGYRIVLCIVDQQPTVEREFIDDLHRLKAYGVIKFPTTPDAEPELRAHIHALGLSYVVLNDFWTDCRSDNHVAFDESAALEQAVAHLAGLGHQRIGWLDGSDGPRERALAFLRRELVQHGLDLADDDILLCPPYDTVPVELLWPGGDSGPTAVITPYDGMAVRLIEALGRVGLSVPGDVSVVNLNGHPFYGAGGVELASAIPPDDDIVAQALAILTDGRDGQAAHHCLFRPGFSEGGTTAPPRRQDRSQATNRSLPC